MLVSIVVPVYKVEFFLGECIESILQQSFKDFELILVDDGSPDNCGEICERYAQMDSRIKVIHQANGGLSFARNAGIGAAKGDYLAFIDSDDFVFPHYLEILVNACLENDADLSVCGMIRCSEKDSLDSFAEEFPEKKNEVFEDNKMNVFFTTKKINTTAWGKLYKRFIFESIKFPVNKYNEDVFTTYKTIHLANKVVFCDYPGYVYRMNEKSIINEAFSLKKLDPIEGCLERAEFIERQYPHLKKYAYRSIIRFSNQALLSMGKSLECNYDVLCRLRQMYRKYWMYYVFNRSAPIGKIYALLALADIKICFLLTKFFYGKICRKSP